MASVTVGRQLGQAEITASADASALRLYEVYRSRKGKAPFESMRFIEIECDNLENEIFSFARWCSSTPIPKFFQNDLQPRGQNNDAPVKLLLKATLSKYIGKVLLLIRRKFPQHEDFMELRRAQDVPQWWTRLRPVFERECDRFHMHLGSEYTFGETSVRPLYSDNEAVGYNSTTIHDYISVIDLRSILLRLMKDAKIACDRDGKLQHRTCLAMLFHAIGRGGEPKFQDYSEWMWHPRFEVLDPGWTELKMLEKYAMPMVPHKNHFVDDIYHCFGSFWSVESGLFRSQQPDQQAIASYVFPDLHSLVDSGVAKKMTTIIRENLPEGCPPEIVNSFSAKSTRRGSITELSTHRSIRGLDVCGRSGHETGTSIDSYLDKSFIVRGLRGAKALAQWKDVEADIKVPRLECLGAHTNDAVQDLLNNLFVVSVPYFRSGQALHIVLRTCAASLIMYHRMVTQELGTANAVSTKLRNSARAANIADARFPGESPETLLDKWSDIIMNDYHERNPEIAPATPDAMQMATVLNQQTQLLIEIRSDVRELKRKSDMDQVQMAALRQDNAELHNQVASLNDQLGHAQYKLGFLRTPPGSSSTANRRRSREEENEQGDDGNGAGKRPRLGEQVSPVVLAASAPTRGSASSVNTAAAQQIAPPHAAIRFAAATQPAQRGLIYGAEAKDTESKSNKRFYIAMVLEQLYKQGRLSGSGSWKAIDPPLQFTEKSSLRNTLELCEVVLSEEDAKVLKNPGSSDEDVKTHAKSVEQKCMRKMLQYEGVDPDFEAQVAKKTNRSQQKQPTYLAVGKRVREYKKNVLAPASGNTGDYNMEVLRDPPQVSNPGTPPGNTSIRSFFGM